MELIYNSITEVNGFTQYLTFNPFDVGENFDTIFDNKGQEILTNYTAKGIELKQTIYSISRLRQFVLINKYDYLTGFITMSFFYANSMDVFLDGFKTLKSQNWKDIDVDKIGNIIQEILNDEFFEKAIMVKNDTGA